MTKLFSYYIIHGSPALSSFWNSSLKSLSLTVHLHVSQNVIYLCVPTSWSGFESQRSSVSRCWTRTSCWVKGTMIWLRLSRSWRRNSRAWPRRTTRWSAQNHINIIYTFIRFDLSGFLILFILLCLSLLVVWSFVFLTFLFELFFIVLYLSLLVVWSFSFSFFLHFLFELYFIYICRCLLSGLFFLFLYFYLSFILF